MTPNSPMGEPINYEQRRDLERQNEHENNAEIDTQSLRVLWIWLQFQNGR